MFGFGTIVAPALARVGFMANAAPLIGGTSGMPSVSGFLIVKEGCLAASASDMAVTEYMLGLLSGEPTVESVALLSFLPASSALIAFRVTAVSGVVLVLCVPGLGLYLVGLPAATAAESAVSACIDSDEGRGLCLREGERANLERREEEPDTSRWAGGCSTSALAMPLYSNLLCIGHREPRRICFW